MKDEMTIGQRIASRRKLANLSQESLGERLGVSRQSISKWESDSGLPDIDNLIALSKIFEVSVGWILGAESDPSYDPSTGLTEAQLLTVKEIVHKTGNRRRRVWVYGITAACILLQFALFSWQIFNIKQESENYRQQISLLEQQINTPSTDTVVPENENNLLNSVTTKASLDVGGETVTVDFYLLPKLYQQNAKPYIVIHNPNGKTLTEKHVQIECSHMGNLYYCRTVLPVQNGYSFSFILSGESGFQEQSLDTDSYVKYLKNLYDTTRFHLGENANTRDILHTDTTEYIFNQPVVTPIICSNGAYGSYVGYKEVSAILHINGIPVHTESLRDEFLQHAGAYMLSAVPLDIHLKVPLPELMEGDILTLAVQAECYDGTFITNTLEEIRITQ